eukprot:5173904-Pyramimonas_sp.AAC.1
MLQVASYVVSGMEEVAAKFNVTGKVNVQFVVDGSGVLSLAKAEAIVELPDLPPPNKTKSGAKANATDEADAKKEGEAKEEGEATGEIDSAPVLGKSHTGKIGCGRGGCCPPGPLRSGAPGYDGDMALPHNTPEIMCLDKDGEPHKWMNCG